MQDYDGTVVLVSHDVEFVRGTAQNILEITRHGIRRFHGGYDYYQEKLAAEAPHPEDAPQKPQEAKVTSKDLRRQRAQERAAKAPEIKRLKRRVAEAEADIARLEAEQAELTAALGDGSLDAQGLAEAGKRLRAIQFDLGKRSLDWEEAATALEALEGC